MNNLVLGILAGVAGLLILIGSINLFRNKQSKIKEKIGAMLGIILSCFLFFVFLCGIDLYTSPHHGVKPTIYDVPMKAHIDTLETISGNDTIRHCTINWNN